MTNAGLQGCRRAGHLAQGGVGGKGYEGMLPRNTVYEAGRYHKRCAASQG